MAETKAVEILRQTHIRVRDDRIQHKVDKTYSVLNAEQLKLWLHRESVEKERIKKQNQRKKGQTRAKRAQAKEAKTLQDCVSDFNLWSQGCRIVGNMMIREDGSEQLIPDSLPMPERSPDINADWMVIRDTFQLKHKITGEMKSMPRKMKRIENV